MKNYGFKISETGVDVNNATDDECIIHSKYSHLKPYVTDIFSYNIPASPDPVTTTIYTHNLNYVPSFQSFIDYNNSGEWRSLSIGGFDSGISCSCDTTKLYLYVLGYSQFAGNNIKVKYYLFIDKIE